VHARRTALATLGVVQIAVRSWWEECGVRAGKSVQIAIAVKEATSNQGAVSIAEWAAASAVAVAWAVASAGKCDVGSSGVGLCRRQRSRLVVSVAEWACSVGSGVGLLRR
jgi:hypothetical protein